MHSEAANVLSGIGKLGSQQKSSEGGKKGYTQEKDPLLVDKATLPVGVPGVEVREILIRVGKTGIFAVHVFGCHNLYLDANFPPEHFGIYVQITVGLITKCTSLQFPFKKGCVVWDEIKNFSVIVSPKATSLVNEVNIAVLGFDKLQPIPKHKLLGKTEFHMHKLAKKQWSMETFELQNRQKKYAGDLQLELAFAYGFYGYGLCDQLESHHPPRYYLQQSAFPHLELAPRGSGNSSGYVTSYKIEKLSQLQFKSFWSCTLIFPQSHTPETYQCIPGINVLFFQTLSTAGLTSVTLLNHLLILFGYFRINFTPTKVPHPSMITFKEKIIDLEPEFSPYYTKTNFMPTDIKSRPRLRQNMTRLSQMYSEYSQMTSRSKRISYLERLLQEKDKHGAVTGDQESDSDLTEENVGDVTQFGLTEALAQMANLTFSATTPDAEKQMSQGSPAVDEVSEMDASPDDDTQDIDNEDYIKVAAAARGRRSAVDARRPSQKMRPSIDRRPTF
ncbi:unnamed protein product [Pocillopora meandrina]|uniref:C2 domain-containing protein n=1 Tax=Pocillopora meandrina TaxID=46732 RepID=A0AAU9WSH6_9CNID|nr:unnamed protein product [Pocillopora meandrina]